jgi:hypothetical protein
MDPRLRLPLDIPDKDAQRGIAADKSIYLLLIDSKEIKL